MNLLTLLPPHYESTLASYPQAAPRPRHPPPRGPPPTCNQTGGKKRRRRLLRSELPPEQLRLLRIKDAARKREQRRAQRDRRRLDALRIQFLLNPEE